MLQDVEDMIITKIKSRYYHKHFFLNVIPVFMFIAFLTKIVNVNYLYFFLMLGIQLEE